MKLLTVGKDISELIEQIKWSGDTKQVARTIQFTIAKNKKDKDFPTVVIDEGAEIIMQDDSGKDVFGGIIFDIDKSASSKVETYLAYDLMFYINNSDVNKIFEGTPETIVPGICTELGIESGTMAATGVNISSMPCFGKKAYEAIMMAYTAAAKQNGSKYIPLMTNINKVSVLEKGTLCGAVMTGDYNLIEATYKSTLQKLVNRVLITDKNNNVIKTVEDAASIQKYGLVQRVLKQNDGEDATTQAKKMLVTVESSATVSGVPNDFRAVSGYSIIVQETDTGLYGQFYIESDTHTFSCGKAQMDLTLAFENLMDEREIEETALKAGGGKVSTNRNIVEMVEAIRKGTGGSNSADGVDGTYMADVLSVKPLTIKMHNTTITKNLYINPALMLNASDSGEDIKKPFITPFEPQEAYEFLKEFHEKYVLKKGDTVVVHITGSSFYIAGKAVKA